MPALSPGAATRSTRTDEREVDFLGVLFIAVAL